MRRNTAGFSKAAAGAAVVCAVALAPRASAAEPDLRVQAGHLLSAMEGDAHRVAGLLRVARASHAPGPIKCVDGYLSQIDADVRHGRDDVKDLHAAIVARDGHAAERAFLWLTTRREAARNASFAADTCVTPNLATDRDHTTVRIVAPTLPTDRAVFSH